MAIIVEQVHEKLAPLLLWEPRSPTHMILVDHLDDVAGSDNPIPCNVITINLTPPFGTTFLVNYEDWLRLVITHEYAHILHLDAVSGSNVALRYLFGHVPFSITPLISSVSILWHPPWLIEVLATLEETELDTSGRRDGTLSEMILAIAAPGFSIRASARMAIRWLPATPMRTPTR